MMMMTTITQINLVVATCLAVLAVGVRAAVVISSCAEIEVEQQPCEQTEYEAYLHCVHSQNEIGRRKRELNCPFAADANETKSLTAGCQQLNFDCRYKCADDRECEDACPVCPVNADQVADDYRTVVFERENGETETFQARIEAGRNVTTIIRLTNIINNTNTIHAPVNVTTKNLNNIQVHAQNQTAAQRNETSDTGAFGLGATADGPCCLVVRPKSCFTSSAGVRCHHKRHKTCGSQCKSRVVHAQTRQRCFKSGKCDKKIVYVPEPDDKKAGRCVYTKQWPFVSCKGDTRRRSSCSGCYDHYGYGYENYHGNAENEEPDCAGCYDDAFDTGPLYRRGPVLRPYYYHQPPCLLMGTCALVPVLPNCGYGCYGDEFVDPAWGHRLRSANGDDNEYEDDYADETAEVIVDADEHIRNSTDKVDEADDWITDGYKCKTVADDGTVEIRNCTSEEYDENPYEASPSEPLDHDVNFDDDAATEDVRHRRHVERKSARVHRRLEARRRQQLWDRDYYVDEDDYEMRRPKHNGHVVEDEEEVKTKRAVRRQPKKHKKEHRPMYVYDEDEDDEDAEVRKTY